MILHLLRIFFLLVVLGITIPFALQQEVVDQGPTYVTLYMILPVAIAFLLLRI